MNCDVCRCYADETFGDPRRDQACGMKHGGYIVPCEKGCCHGGCPGQNPDTPPAEPYGFGKMQDMRIYIRAILSIFALSFILLYLKIWGL
jgi:hypothetical protein